MNQRTSFLLFDIVLWVLFLQGLILLPLTDAGANSYYGCMNVIVSSSGNDIDSGRDTTDDESVMICADYYESTWSYTSSMDRDESPYHYDYSYIIRDPNDYSDPHEELFRSEKEYNDYISNIEFLDFDLYDFLPQYVTVEIPYSRTGSCTIAVDGQECEKCTICDTNIRGDNVYMDASISVDCTNIFIGEAQPNSDGRSNELMIKSSDSCTPLQPLYFPFVVERSSLLTTKTAAFESTFFQLKVFGANGGCIGIDNESYNNNKLEDGISLMLVRCANGSNNDGRESTDQDKSLFWSYNSKMGLIHSKIDSNYCWTIRGDGNSNRKIYLYQCFNGEEDYASLTPMSSNNEVQQQQLSQKFFLDHSIINSNNNRQTKIRFGSSENNDCVAYRGSTPNINSDPIVIKKCDSVQNGNELKWELVVTK